jgi:hypothetical protein
MTDSQPNTNDWRFTLEGGYIQSVATTFELMPDGALRVAVEARRVGKITGRKSPWTAVAMARVANTKIHCDMWENERWNSENFMKSLHDAVMES